MAKQNKLRFISGLILAVLLLWYSSILYWPMKQVTVPFETSPANHDSLQALELGAGPGVVEDTRTLSSQDSLNRAGPGVAEDTRTLSSHDSLNRAGPGVAEDTRTLSSHDSLNRAGPGVAEDTRTLSSQDSLNENLLIHEKKSNSATKVQEVESEDNNYEYPWELCQPMRYFSESESHPLTALASFPGSGNTWTRYLLQQSTGIHTGFANLGVMSKTLLEHGFPGEAVADARVVVIKTHRLLRNNHVNFQRAVLIIREPGAAILANYNHMYSKGNKTGIADWNTFSIYWKRHFNNQLPRWRDTNLDWLQNFKGPLHVVMYEDLVNNLEVTLRALITFLELPVNEEALQCTLQRPEGIFHRKQQKYPFELFDKGMINKIKAEENVVYQEIKRRRG